VARLGPYESLRRTKLPANFPANHRASFYLFLFFLDTFKIFFVRGKRNPKKSIHNCDLPNIENMILKITFKVELLDNINVILQYALIKKNN